MTQRLFQAIFQGWENPSLLGHTIRWREVRCCQGFPEMSNYLCIIHLFLAPSVICMAAVTVPCHISLLFPVNSYLNTWSWPFCLHSPPQAVVGGGRREQAARSLECFSGTLSCRTPLLQHSTHVNHSLHLSAQISSTHSNPQTALNQLRYHLWGETKKKGQQKERSTFAFLQARISVWLFALHLLNFPDWQRNKE